MYINSIIQSITDTFNSSIIRSNICNASWRLSGLLLLELDTTIKTHTIYLGTMKAAAKLAEALHAPVDCLFIVSGKNAETNLPGYLNYMVIDEDISPIFNHISSIISDTLELNEKESSYYDNIIDILNGSICGEDEIRMILSQSLTELHQFFTLLLLFFRKKPNEETINSCTERLREIFPSSYIPTINDRILIIHSHPQKYVSFPPQLRSALNVILEEYDAYASISSRTSKSSMIANYYKTISVLADLEMKMGLISENRTLLHEEYGTHFALHLCCQQYEQTFGNRDIPYLAHPAIITLLRYDKEHNTDLCPTLICYLLADCSITRTAEQTFAHRNTVLNKIKKIKDIIGTDLDNSRINFNLIFSYMLINYYEKYLGEPIRP